MGLCVVWVLTLLSKTWYHPLYLENPFKYTQRGKLRTTTQGRFTPGTKLPHRSGPIPPKILDIWPN